MAAILSGNVLTNLGLREIVPDQTAVEQWKELVLDTGGTHSTLQGIKLPEGATAGGFCYKESQVQTTRNRFIYWRIIHDTLEFVEESLEFLLVGNRLRIKLQGLLILEGVSIHETGENIVLLIPTVSSIHKLVLRHPQLRDEKTLLKSGNPALPSVFAEANVSWLRDPSSYHIINSNTANSLLPYTAATCLLQTDNEPTAVFALANEKTIQIFRFGASVSSSVIQPASFTARLLSGLIPSIIRGAESVDATVSVCLQNVGSDALLWALTREGRLKVWSILTQECRLIQDLVEHLGGGASKQVGGQRHVLRLTDDLDGQTKLAAFLCFAKQKIFLVMKPVFTAAGIQIDWISNTVSPQHYLIDFVLTAANLFALWSDQKGDHVLKYFGIASKGSAQCSGWLDVVLDSALEVDIEYDDELHDPKEVFLSHIFQHGRFSLSTLYKALQAFQQSSGSAAVALSAGNLSRGALKQAICAAVEAEIHSQASEYELEDDDYSQLSHSCWSQFYACVVQYHQKRPVPLGLVLSNETGMMCLIKKGMISFLRPMDVVESLMLVRGRKWDVPPLNEFFPDSFSAADFLEDLFGMLATVREKLGREQITRFEQQLYQLESADQIAAAIVKDLLNSTGFSLLDCISKAANEKTCVALMTVLQMLGFDIVQPGDSEGEFSEDFRCFQGYMGREVIVESVRQMAELRFGLCRDILILQQLLIAGTEVLKLDPKVAETIRSEFVPRTVPLAHAYYALTWLCRSSVNPVSNSLLEQNIRLMSVLDIVETDNDLPVPDNLVNYFLMTEGGIAARSLAVNEVEGISSRSDWLEVMPLLVSALGQLLWPLGQQISLMKFLMSRCQPLAAQGYVRLLQHWCEWNSFSRKFLLGMALLTSGEGEKALRYMLEAADGVTKEEFLAKYVTRSNPEDFDDLQEIVIKFYLVAIQLFEQVNLSSGVLQLADKAIRSASLDDPLLPTMWSILAKHHLKLGHNEAAYDAVIKNPDPNRRPDILQQLLNTLIERRQMNELLRFPYEGLETEVERFMEMRARSSDLSSSKIYYAFLYAFHTHRGNMRKAASVMYEQAFRFASDGKGLEDDKQQVKCLLACLNALRLVKKEDTWLVKPVDAVRGVVITKPSLTVDVVEFEDIEKEYELAFARLKLSRDTGTKQVIPFSAAEIVTLLFSSHKYETALRLAQIHSVDPSPLLEHLATSCVYLARDSSLEAEAWTWLSETSGAENCKASEQAWKLLEKLTHRAEKGGETRCHKAIGQRILNHDCALPHWLVASYRKRNPGELISLYHKAGLLEDATRIALEYVDALMGKGKENYDLKFALHSSSPAVCLPYTVYDRLYKELDYHSKDPAVFKLKDSFKRKMEFYLDTVHRVSLQMME